MERSSFQHDGLTLSYLDSGGDGPALVASIQWACSATSAGPSPPLSRYERVRPSC